MWVGSELNHRAVPRNEESGPLVNNDTLTVADDDSVCVDCGGLVAQRAVLRCECGVTLCALCRGVKCSNTTEGHTEKVPVRVTC